MMKASFFELEDRFAPIAQSVANFADANKLRLKKCPRGNSGWEVVGSHPHGGELFLLLMYESELGLGIGSVWQYPCAETSRLYTHFRNISVCPIEPDEVIRRLDEELCAIRSVKFGYWTNINPLTPTNDA